MNIQYFDIIRPQNTMLQASIMTLFAICMLSTYSAKSNAAGIFDNVPINLIPLYAQHNILPSNDVVIELGAVKYTMDNVPVTVGSNITGIKSIVILAVENQHPLVAVFNINSQSFSSLQTNIRLEKYSDIVALIDTGEQIYGNSIRVGQP